VKQGRTTHAAPAPRQQAWPRKVLTYAGGSAVATGCSELTLLVVYGLWHAPAATASLLAWLAGAIPNYWLNRTWTWRRRGRPSMRAEVVPYAVIIGLTLLLAVLATKTADWALRSAGVSSTTRVAVVAIVFLGVYVVMFVVRFLLLDRMFGRLAARESENRGGEVGP
jgi:putative flippase GtrA